MTPLPAFGSLAACEYADLGLRIGLEVHQQLLTEKKLFCRCPAGRRSRRWDARILRHMRPTLSELGEVDATALMEFKTRKQILYHLDKESVCTYEMDDAPPFPLNEQALDIAMEIALLLDVQPVGELHVIRKQFLDGSIPAGFQRTALLGVDGAVPVGDRRVRIQQLGLEEDSCRELSDEGHWRTFATDRLGTPLVEIVTAPDMRTPGEAMRTAQAIRALTRATGRVRRGIGAARQDVNVSITGGTRVEIAGVPRIPAIGRLAHNEAFRQKGLLAIRDALRSRRISGAGYAAPRAEVTGLLGNCEYAPVRRARERGETVGAVLLPGFEALLTRELQPGAWFLQEFIDRVRVVACLDRRPNLVCSEQLGDGPGLMEWNRVRQVLGGPPEAPVLLVWGHPRDVDTALVEITLRAQEALAGVPAETRQALLDGTTGFERVLPGPERMYPDTDLPPLVMDTGRWERARERMAAPPWALDARLAERGLGPELRRQLIAQGRAGAYLDLAADAPDPVRLAVLFTAHWRRLEREGLAMPDPADLAGVGAFQAAAPRQADLAALRDWARGGGARAYGAGAALAAHREVTP
ncbi:MAG: Glu-tRNA(Gln) amidotransferase subunit GatE [Candidatus Krumholzibacteriota bacterium]|nr:Glu-tRNA(Gln) amidotransferase subunit GatE [Candidatus Krumholzibacteriota bacterium]